MTSVGDIDREFRELLGIYRRSLIEIEKGRSRAFEDYLAAAVEIGAIKDSDARRAISLGEGSVRTGVWVANPVCGVVLDIVAAIGRRILSKRDQGALPAMKRTYEVWREVSEVLPVLESVRRSVVDNISPREQLVDEAALRLGYIRDLFSEVGLIPPSFP